MRIMKALMLLAAMAGIAAAQNQPVQCTITSTASTCPSVRVQNNSTVGIIVSGTGSGTLTPTLSIYGSLPAAPVNVNNTSTGASALTITATSTTTGYWANVGGFTQFNLSPTAWTSGTATVQIFSTLATNEGAGAAGGSSVTVTSPAGSPSDSAANPAAAVFTEAFNMLWNPLSSDWDRMVSAEAGQNVGPTGIPGVYCNFVTAPATITSGNFSPLGCDNAGNMLVRVNVPLPAGSNAIGQVTAVQASGSNLHVNVDNNQTSASGSLTNASSASCTGAGVGGNGVTVATAGAASVAIGVTGSNTATISFYYSIDGSNYQAVPSSGLFQVLPAAGGTAVTGFSANGQWVFQVNGASDFMVCGPAGAAQTATISLQATLAPGPLTVTVNNIPPVSQSGNWTARVVGNGGATVDAAVTPATAPANGFDTLGEYNTSAPAPTAAQTTSVQQDQSSNALTFPGVQFKTGAGWTSGTSGGTFQYPTGTTTAGQLQGAAAVLVQLDQTTTISGGVVTWQGTYDNVNWVTIPTTQVLNPNTFAQLTNPYTLVASTNQPFLIPLQGYVNVRADLSTAITGSATVTPYWATLSSGPGFLNINLATINNVVPGVKAASTVVAATDPSIVVQQSPLGVNPCIFGGGAAGSGLSIAVGVTSGTSAVQAIAASAGQRIYVCSVVITGVSGTLPTLSLVTGTGSNCASSQTVVLPAFATTGTAAYPFPGPLVTITPASGEICYLDGGTTPVQNYLITYVQK